jgi:hypothetical protein
MNQVAFNHPNICHLYDVGPNYLVNPGRVRSTPVFRATRIHGYIELRRLQGIGHERHSVPRTDRRRRCRHLRSDGHRPIYVPSYVKE